MHIIDGALDMTVVGAGALCALGGLAYGLKRLPLDLIPTAGVISAALFVASLVHVPVGPTSVHLVLNGLAGLVLGWAAFPVVFVALLLQAIFFGYGGITVLGVNTVSTALPAVLVWWALHATISNATPRLAGVVGGIGGALAVLVSALVMAVSLVASGDEFIVAAQLTLLSHIPVMVVEGVLTGAAVYLIARVRPELLRLLSVCVTPARVTL